MVQHKRIVILGGGISGLALAWYLHDHFDVIVLEKENRVGGWIRTDICEGFLFEKGPRTFRAQENALLQLARDLNLDLIYTPSQKRYLFQEGRLKEISKWSILRSLFQEWRVPYLNSEETIEEFALRRFNPQIANSLFDAMALGVFAGDMATLSIDACFPKFKEWEKNYGSLAKALLFNLKNIKGGGLFSFRQGAESLVKALEERLRGKVILNSEVKKLQFYQDQIEVFTKDHNFVADFVVSALPPQTLGHLIEDHELIKMKMQPLHVVNLGYRHQVLNKKGFGYLIPTQEKETLLGVVFDSNLFPEQHPQGTCLTVMLRETDSPIEKAIEGVKRHLNIQQFPNHYQSTNAFIPQYEKGHLNRISQIKQKVTTLSPRLHLLGNYLYGVSVADCVEKAKELAENLRTSTR